MRERKRERESERERVRKQERERERERDMLLDVVYLLPRRLLFVVPLPHCRTVVGSCSLQTWPMSAPSRTN